MTKQTLCDVKMLFWKKASKPIVIEMWDTILRAGICKDWEVKMWLLAIDIEGYNENLLQVNSKLFWYNIYS